MVRVCSGVPDLEEEPSQAETAPGPGNRASDTHLGNRLFSVTPDLDAPWQAGLDRLADPGSMQRFLTSRLLYRRFARLAWWLLLPLAAALFLRLPFVATGLDHLFFGHPGPRRAINAARSAGWGPRLLVAAVVSAVELAVLAAVLTLLGRKAWRTLGGGQLEGIFGDSAATTSGATANDTARDAARVLTGRGYAGMVTGATLQAELTHLGQGFFACAGTSGEVVEEHPGRLGLLPVFLEHRQVAWVELETGAELHARLLLARIDIPPATVSSASGPATAGPMTNIPWWWPPTPKGHRGHPAPDLGALHNRSRRVQALDGGRHRRGGCRRPALGADAAVAGPASPRARAHSSRRHPGGGRTGDVGGPRAAGPGARRASGSAPRLGHLGHLVVGHVGAAPAAAVGTWRSPCCRPRCSSCWS